MTEKTNTNVEVSVEKQTLFMRFSRLMRLQHFVLLMSCIVLMGTGVPLWLMSRMELVIGSGVVAGICSGLWKLSFLIFGDIATVRMFHQWAAIGLIAVSCYHIFYTTFVREGRKELFAFMPMPKDFLDVFQNSLYFLHLSNKRPKFARYSYFEKFDYWAVYWGCVMMIGTGFVLWFDKIVPQAIAGIIPAWNHYDVAAMAKLVHSDEAILCTLALVVWHFFNVHYSKWPKSFGSSSWFTGAITREDMVEEHGAEYEKMLAEEKKKK